MHFFGNIWQQLFCKILQQFCNFFATFCNNFATFLQHFVTVCHSQHFATFLNILQDFCNCFCISTILRSSRIYPSSKSGDGFLENRRLPDGVLFMNLPILQVDGFLEDLSEILMIWFEGVIFKNVQEVPIFPTY